MIITAPVIVYLSTMKVTVVVLVLISLAWQVKSARILGVFPFPARSHYILGNTFMKGLAERGHDVTIIAPFEDNSPPKNGSFKTIFLSGFVEKTQERMKGMNFFERDAVNPFLNVIFVTMFSTQVSEDTLNHTNVQNLLHSDEKFDAVIVEQFMNGAHDAFATHFNAPLITFSPVGTHYWINSLVGNPSPPSYIPHLMMDLPVKMTFCQRLYNVGITFFSLALDHLYIYPQQRKLVKQYFSNNLDMDDAMYNASLVLFNSHPSLNQAVPYVPNMVDIGGFHVKPPKKLPQDLQDFLDDAKDGVVYFSMGSNLRSAQFPAEKRDAILKAFGKLKQKVLWKWEEDVLPGQPSNVKLGKWLPQQDILAHPNVKVFITHGGMLSTTETVYHGVPVLAIPIFGDQKTNAQNAVKNGFGRLLPYNDISEETLTEHLNELLYNPKYFNNVKTRSKLFHDRPLKPMENGVYWVEYVIRHGGTPHLRVAALDLPWYQYFLLDVIAFIVVVSLPVLYVSYLINRKLMRLVLSKVCHKSKGKKVKTQ